jgi:hypothetical protein
LDPKVWLRGFLGEVIKGKDFSRRTFDRQVSHSALWAGEGHPLGEMANSMAMWFHYAENVSQFFLTVFFQQTMKFMMYFFSYHGCHPQ